MTTSKLPSLIDMRSILKGSSLGIITSSGWPFVSAVLGQMAHLVTSITLGSARSCVIKSTFLTQGAVSSIPIIFSWSDKIRPEGFPSSILLCIWLQHYRDPGGHVVGEVVEWDRSGRVGVGNQQRIPVPVDRCSWCGGALCACGVGGGSKKGKMRRNIFFNKLGFFVGSLQPETWAGGAAGDAEAMCAVGVSRHGGGVWQWSDSWVELSDFGLSSVLLSGRDRGDNEDFPCLAWWSMDFGIIFDEILFLGRLAILKLILRELSPISNALFEVRARRSRKRKMISKKEFMVDYLLNIGELALMKKE
ncbi:hypothetical protein Tco_1118778 [Tanacetum coccineum]